MKVTIEIDPMDYEDVLTHLSVIRARIKKEFKRLEKICDLENPNELYFEDNNCYGIHQVRIDFKD